VEKVPPDGIGHLAGYENMAEHFALDVFGLRQTRLGLRRYAELTQ
jgi:hypothetical protein